MGTHVMKTFTPPAVGVPRGADWVGQMADWWSKRQEREHDLLKLAEDVEGDDPELATELRGIAMHEASAAAAAIAKPPADSWLRRAGRRIYAALEASGQRRAERELRGLAQRWEHSQPELAKELHLACDRRVSTQ